MSSTAVIPSTIEGIKRFATSLKRELQVPHWKALDVAAHRAGYSNFRNAKKELATPSARTKAPKNQDYPIWITAYWRDREQQRSGRETLRVLSRHSWRSLLRTRELASARGLCEFRLDADDHLEARRDLTDQVTAQRKVCEAARTLQFMEATGLRPLTTRLPRIASEKVQSLPLRDHATSWRDPVTGRCYVVDEPYRPAERVLPAREPWAQERGAAIGVSSWPGMYNPGSSTLYLTSPDGDEESVKRLVRNLDAASEPPDAEHWTGESAAYSPQFISPARSSSGRKKRGRPRPLYVGLIRHDAIVYGHIFHGGSWRPNARMPLATHLTTANLLKEVLRCGGFRSRAYSQVEHVRSELDEWVQREYTSREELSDDEFGNLYYHEDFEPTGVASTEALARVEELLRTHYPDCVPRRDVLRCLAAAKKDLAR